MPLLAVHACDDPIAAVDGFDKLIERADNPNLWLLATRNGGHVGWPEGWWPASRGWSFMRRTVYEFAGAVLADAPSTSTSKGLGAAKAEHPRRA